MSVEGETQQVYTAACRREREYTKHAFTEQHTRCNVSPERCRWVTMMGPKAKTSRRET